MRVTILGCGTSTGVPLISCRCPVCRSTHAKNKRLRSSVLIECRGKKLLIDTATDLRQQALRYKVGRVDAVLYTHPHADHVNGIDEMRSYNYLQRATIPVFGNAWSCTELKQKFRYIFDPKPVEGGDIPALDLHQFDASVESLDVVGVPVVPIAAFHGSKECIGYRINRIAYVTDCSYIPSTSLDRMRKLSVLFLDCLRYAPHGTHYNLDQALAVVAEVKPKKTFLTHLGHDFDYAKTSRKLPKGVHLAYDGLKVFL